MSSVNHPRGTSASHAHQAEQSGSHARHAHAPSHGLGHFGGYTFRSVTRAPAQGARRSSPLRSRPSPQQAQTNGDNAQGEFDPSLRDSGDLDADERRQPPQIETGHTGADPQDERPPAPPQKRLKVRVPPAAPAPAQPLAARLQQAGWPGTDVLWGKASPRPTDEQYVQALLAGLLAAASPPATRPAAAGSGTAIAMALTAAFLGTGANAQQLSTLTKVRQQLMEASAKRAPRPRAVPLTEAERSANVLNPVRALNMSRPRTPQQCSQAISRQGLLSQSPSVQGACA